MKLIEIKKQGCGYSIYCDGAVIVYGISANSIFNSHRMFILGLAIGGIKYKLSDESFGILNEADDIAQEEYMKFVDKIIDEA